MYGLKSRHCTQIGCPLGTIIATLMVPGLGPLEIDIAWVRGRVYELAKKHRLRVRVRRSLRVRVRVRAEVEQGLV